jgi:tRNA (guanine37-N1)-methyltransferase
MLIEVITIFPGMFASVMTSGVTGKAQERGILNLRAVNLRDFCTDRHRVTDDYPFGGGAGLVMKPEPVFRAMEHLRAGHPEALGILTSPRGERFTQEMARELAARQHLIFLCGRYRGVDERARENLFDREVSLGDYVLSGGELAAMVMIDVIARLLPGTLGNADSLEEESFSPTLLDSPQYTRPQEFEGMSVPEVLVSGDHKEIELWRRQQALKATRKHRPDLLDNKTT